MSDDYCSIANGRELGAWDSVSTLLQYVDRQLLTILFCQSDGAA